MLAECYGSNCSFTTSDPSPVTSEWTLTDPVCRSSAGWDSPEAGKRNYQIMDTVDIADPAPHLVSAPTFFGRDQRYLVDGSSPLIFLVTAGSDLWLDESLESLEDRGREWEKEARIRFAAGGGNNPVQPLIAFRCRFTVGCQHTIASPHLSRHSLDERRRCRLPCRPLHSTCHVLPRSLSW